MEAKVFFDPIVYQKIMFWVQKSTVEISGLGKIQITDSGDIIVTSAILVEQENTGSSTDMKPEAIAKAMFLMKDEPGELRFWWHSHVNMPVFWSGTDTKTIEELGEHGFFVSTVFNKKREWRTAIFQKKPYRIFKDEVQTSLYTPTNLSLVGEWQKEFDEKCKSKWDNYKSHASKDARRTQAGTTTPSQIDYHGYESAWNDDLVTDNVKSFLAIDEAFRPDYIDSYFVYCFNGEEISRSEYQTRFNVDLKDPELKGYVDYEAPASHSPN
jgi:hypothetical protein